MGKLWKSAVKPCRTTLLACVKMWGSCVKIHENMLTDCGKVFSSGRNFAEFSIDLDFSKKCGQTVLTNLWKSRKKGRDPPIFYSFPQKSQKQLSTIGQLDFSRLRSFQGGEIRPFPHSFPHDCGKLLKTCWKVRKFIAEVCGKVQIYKVMKNIAMS